VSKPISEVPYTILDGSRICDLIAAHCQRSYVQASVVSFSKSQASEGRRYILRRNHVANIRSKSRPRCRNDPFVLVAAQCYDPCQLARGHLHCGATYGSSISRTNVHHMRYLCSINRRRRHLSSVPSQPSARRNKPSQLAWASGHVAHFPSCGNVQKERRSIKDRVATQECQNKEGKTTPSGVEIREDNTVRSRCNHLSQTSVCVRIGVSKA
jgi:hypothetical protein